MRYLFLTLQRWIFFFFSSTLVTSTGTKGTRLVGAAIRKGPGLGSATAACWAERFRDL